MRGGLPSCKVPPDGLCGSEVELSGLVESGVSPSEVVRVFQVEGSASAREGIDSHKRAAPEYGDRGQSPPFTSTIEVWVDFEADPFLPYALRSAWVSDESLFFLQGLRRTSWPSPAWEAVAMSSRRSV